MSLPETLTDRLDGEEAVAEVELGGDDRLLVTPTRTLVYRAEGLLSDETVEEFAHDAERITVSTGRRKATLTLDYGLDGEETISVPKGRLDEVLHPLLAGVLDAHGVTEPGETVKRTFRFSELTLVVTSQRVVKHIGQAVWDEEYEEYPFENVTDLAFEPGNVATSVVITHDGRQERFKAPNDEARAVEAAITDALLSYYDVHDLDELRALSAEEAGDDAEDAGTTGGDVDSVSPFGEGPDLLGGGSGGTDETDESTATPTDGVADPLGGAAGTGAVADAGTGGAAASGDDDVAELVAEVDDLREAVERQRGELERQSDLIEQLIQELRQGR